MFGQQQCGELGLVGPLGRRIDPREVWRQGFPALCPAPPLPRVGSPWAGPFPPRVSFPSTASHAAFVYGNTLGLRDIQPFEVQSHVPHGPVYTSDLALPRSPQDSVPIRLLWL